MWPQRKDTPPPLSFKCIFLNATAKKKLRKKGRELFFPKKFLESTETHRDIFWMEI